MEKFALALSRFRRNKLDESIMICDELLKINQDDLAVQLLKTHAIRRKSYIDDLEVDEEGIGEMLLDDHKLSNAPRAGTSLGRLKTGDKGISPLVRPTTSSGRPLSGVVRPATGQQRQGTSNNLNRLQTGMNRAVSRGTTSGGRYLRIATVSLQSINSSLSLNAANIVPKSVVKKKSLAKAVVDYFYYVEKNYKKILEICWEAINQYGETDWWWKYKLGKVYYKLGMLGDAEKQLLACIKQVYNSNAILQLSNLYLKMDQPIKAMETLSKASIENPGELYFVIYQARIQEMLNEYEVSMSLYKNVLNIDNCNFEAIACIGSHHFYSDQPEIALKFYKRLFELGINSAEIWNNLGLAAYYSGQYDFCLSCFERALITAEDEIAGDVWYNISHVAIGLGDLPLAYQALKITIAYNGDHFEAFNNLGVLEIKKGNFDQAKSNFILSCKNTDFSFEPYYNYAAMRFKQGDLEEALKFSKKSSEIFPDHFESRELKEKISKDLYV